MSLWKWTSWARLLFFGAVVAVALTIAWYPPANEWARGLPWIPVSADEISTVCEWIAAAALAVVLLPVSRRAVDSGLQEAAVSQRTWDAGISAPAAHLELDVRRLPERSILSGSWLKIRRVQRALVRQAVAARIAVITVRLEPGAQSLDVSVDRAIERHTWFARLPRRSGWDRTHPILVIVEVAASTPVDVLEHALNRIRGWHEAFPNRCTVVCTDALPSVDVRPFTLVELGDGAAMASDGPPPPFATMPATPNALSERREILAPLALCLTPALIIVIVIEVAVLISGRPVPIISASLGVWMIAALPLSAIWSMSPPRAIARSLPWTLGVAGALAFGLMVWRLVLPSSGQRVLFVWDTFGAWATLALVLALVIRRAELFAVSARSVAWCVALLGFTWLTVGTDQVFLAIGLLGALIATTKQSRHLEVTVLAVLAVGIGLSVAMFVIPLGADPVFSVGPSALAGAIAVWAIMLARAGVALASASLWWRRLYWVGWTAICLMAPIPVALDVWDRNEDPSVWLPLMVVPVLIAASYALTCYLTLARRRLSTLALACALALPVVPMVIAMTGTSLAMDSLLAILGELMAGMLLTLSLTSRLSWGSPEFRSLRPKSVAAWFVVVSLLLVFVAPWAGSVIAELNPQLSEFLRTFSNVDLIWPMVWVAVGVGMGLVAKFIWYRGNQHSSTPAGQTVSGHSGLVARGPRTARDVSATLSRSLIDLGRKCLTVATDRITRVERATSASTIGPATPGKRGFLIVVVFGVAIGAQLAAVGDGGQTAGEPLNTLDNDGFVEMLVGVALVLLWMVGWLVRHGGRDVFVVLVLCFPTLLDRFGTGSFNTAQTILGVMFLALLLGGPSHLLAARRFRRKWIEIWICLAAVVAYYLAELVLQGFEFWVVTIVTVAPLLLFLVVREPGDSPLSYRVERARRTFRRVARSMLYVTIAGLLSGLLFSYLAIQELQMVSGSASHRDDSSVEYGTVAETLGRVLTEAWWLVIAIALVFVGLLYLWLYVGRAVRAAGARQWWFGFSGLRRDVDDLYSRQDYALAGSDLPLRVRSIDPLR